MKYEIVQDHVSASVLWKICSTLGCSIDAIFDLPELGPPPPDATSPVTSLPDDQAVLAAYRRIGSPDVRMRVARLVPALAAQAAPVDESDT